MRCTISILFYFLIVIGFAQNNERVSISGRIVVESQDKEGVTVFNSSSNKGTITDEQGNFQIDVAVNDVVQFGALQFKDFSVIISEAIVKSKQMTVMLIEEVNKLDEVILLPYGLSGFLTSDIDQVRTFNTDMDVIFYGIENMVDFQFEQDFLTKVDNPSFDDYHPTVENGLNFVNLAGLIWTQFTGSKTSGSSKTEQGLDVNVPAREILERYGPDYLNLHFNIPYNKADSFLAYLETQGVNSNLYRPQNEVLLLERISHLSQSFLESEGEKR